MFKNLKLQVERSLGEIWLTIDMVDSYLYRIRNVLLKSCCYIEVLFEFSL